jgi:uncharacterized protein YcsI (UPF0317 family)
MSVETKGFEPAQPDMPGLNVRLACRTGAITGHTSGLAPGHVQGNLAILPKDLAQDFLRFCQANPKPCPVIGVADVGSPHVPSLGKDLDLRSDLPRYRVWRKGELIAEPTDIHDYWRDDLVGFVIGCSLSFEEALIEAGLRLHYVDRGQNVPMFRTNIACTPAGVFKGPMVVSMRSFNPADAIRAIQITSRFPSVHGAPIHIGLPEAIGIPDIAKPDYGDSVPPLEGELPVFWACGVTPQSVIATAKPDFAITHAPGAMLVTDRKNVEFAIF